MIINNWPTLPLALAISHRNSHLLRLCPPWCTHNTSPRRVCHADIDLLLLREGCGCWCCYSSSYVRRYYILDSADTPLWCDGLVYVTIVTIYYVSRNSPVMQSPSRSNTRAPPPPLARPPGNMYCRHTRNRKRGDDIMREPMWKERDSYRARDRRTTYCYPINAGPRHVNIVEEVLEDSNITT